MKKNIIGIIAIGVLGGLVASGCTYSKGKIPVADMETGFESQKEAGEKSTGEVAEGEEEIAPPSDAASSGVPPSGAGSGGSEEAGDDDQAGAPMFRTSPLAVKSVALLSDNRTFIVTFNKPVDVQAAIQNQSIVVKDMSHLFPKTLKGTLFSSLLSAEATFSTVFGFTLDESEKELHVDTSLNIVAYQIEAYGLDSDVSSKAVKSESGVAMAHEYQHLFVCGNDWNTDQTTYVQGCPAISTP